VQPHNHQVKPYLILVSHHQMIYFSNDFSSDEFQ